MAWTTPKTWTAATLTSSDLNTHIRNNMRETMPYLANAQGDLFIGDAANSMVVVPIGTNTHVLTVDTAETSGWKWANARGNTYGQFASVQGTSGSASTRNYSGGHVPGNVMAATADDTCYMGLVVPANFSALTTLEIVYSFTSISTGDNIVIGASIQYGQPLGSLSQVSFGPVTETESITLQGFDLSTGVTLTAGDVIGASFTRFGTDAADGETNDVFVWGLYMEYTD